MIQLNANKKKKEVYGPTRENSEKISDNVMQSALRRFQSTPEIAARKKTFEADRAKFLADNTLKGMTTPTFPSRARLVENPEEVIKNGIKNKVPVNELMPVWNQYWGEVQENVKNDPSLAPYMYNQTYRDWQTYTGQDSDISEQIKSAIARGADPFEVEQLLSKRTYKATENPYLSDYAYDDVYEMAREYIEENQKEYKDNYKDEIAEKMANRNKPFSYSVTDDPLYQQYLKQARAQGRMAMEDTLSEAAIGAGGMNSYAVAAAQGMNNNYMQKVNDVIPELYQLAYNKHLNEQNRQAEDISLMMALENQDYNRWATERTRNDELENLIYGRTLNDENTKYQRDVYENQLDYERDVYADERDYAREIAEREWNYAMENDNFEKAMAFAKIGVIDEKSIAGSGVPREVFEQVKNIALGNASRSSGSPTAINGVSSKDVGNSLGNIAGEIGERALNLKEKTYIIGYGFASDEEFDKLVAEGKIGQDEDTKVFHYIG